MLSLIIAYFTGRNLMGEFKSAQLEMIGGSLCSNPDCEEIISRLAGVVRERMRKETEWGLNDAYVAARYGLLDYGECVAKAATFGITETAFEVMYKHSRPSLLKRTAFLWKELRKGVLDRDGRCASCNMVPNRVAYNVPPSRGGHPLDPCNMRSLCSCPTREKKTKKAMSLLKGSILSAGEAVNPRLSVIVETDTRPASQSGHRPTKAVLFNNWLTVKGLLFALVGTRKRVEMLMEGLRLQATRGKCYAAAGTLADKAGANEKTWDRLSASLRSQDLIATARLMRKNRSLSTNLTDFSVLWSLLLKLLRGSIPKLERLSDGSLWAQLKGLWIPLEDLLLESLPPPEAHSQPSLL